MSISKAALNHPVLTLVIFSLLGIMGLFTLKNMTLNLYPNIEEPTVMVVTSYENAGPESVEKSITLPLEESLISVGKLKKLSSTSSEGSSSITLEFNQGTNLDAAVNEIRDKLDEVKNDLPTGGNRPSIYRMNMSSMPVMTVAVRGNKSVNEMNQIAKEYIKPRLSQADGVAKAEVWGGAARIVRVELSQNRLEAYGLTLTQVSTALAAQNLELSGGKITENAREYSIRTTGEFPGIDSINESVIETVNGYNVRLSDIGRAFDGYKDETSCVYINGTPGVSINIQKQSGANTVKVANAVYEKIDDINKTLPEGIRLEIIEDGSAEIRSAISALTSSLMQGLILAVLVLFVFLKGFKSTIIISISIPLSLLITLLAMYLCGLSLNLMTMTGLILGVGMIVDASIVMLENISTYRARGAKPKIAAILGSQEMIMSVVSGNLTTICVFIPFIFYKTQLGTMGTLFEGVIFTVVIALLASLFVAVFLVPVLAGHFLPVSNRKEKPVTNRVLKKLYALFDAGYTKVLNVYRTWLSAALSHRRTTIIAAAVILAVSLALIPFLNVTMMPDSSSESVTLNVTMPVGTAYQTAKTEMLAWQDIAQKEIKGAKSIVVNIGTSLDSSDSSGKGSIVVYLPTADKQIDTSAAVKTKLRRHFSEFSASTFSFGSDMDSTVSGSDLDIAVRSSSFKDAFAAAQQIQKIMRSIDGVAEPVLDTSAGLPQVQIAIDRDRAALFGVSVTTAANEISACINGIKSSTYRSNGREYSIYVMYEPADRTDVIDLNSIFAAGTTGRVCVANFADIVKGTGPVSILRENQSETVHVTAKITSNTRANIIEHRIADEIKKSIVVPDDVTISYEGSWSKISRQMSVFMSIIILAMLLVFGVMAGTYESFKAPLINMLTIPFMIIGVVLAYFITGQPFSVISAIGLVMLVGIVVNNGIILVDYTGLLIARGMDIKTACLEAGVSRLRPVLMTTLTTILGTIPMALATQGSAALIQPIGLCIIGGLTSSTFVTLLLIPVMYSLIMKPAGRSLPSVQTTEGETK